MNKERTMLKVGFLGGGQLARMMALKAHEMGIEPHVLCESSEDPAAQVTRFWHKGSFNQQKDLETFFKSVDVVTFESEFCDTNLMRSAYKKAKTPIYPSLKAIAMIQDRLSQKKSLLKLGFKTSPFIKVDSRLHANKALREFPKGVVLKRRRFGYDGYGTYIIRTQDDLDQLDDQLFKVDGGFIAEAFVPFKRELAIMGFRNRKGEFTSLPLSETYQEESRCLWVKGPITHRNEKQIQRLLKKYMDSLNYVGALAIELFDVKGELWVNEVAPRVHNSGHYSLDGLDHDQFSLHIRAILNHSLPTPTLVNRGYAMYNLIGHSHRPAKWKLSGPVKFHWYGKHDNRPGRKMGHINSSGQSANKALKILEDAIKEFKL